ncbi:two-component response regulator ARR14-like [Benincasa hispida]|uniref:two-component response regulator ARR14-like n=1 Tax=Benincasa hispida TaxID=102211 RepID=UPI001902B5D5|nr:two-component response regulator ARR14-like [Benincasa hispida]
MPQMNGLQLQKKVMQEFNLPVIMMSADEKPSVILKSLEEGVAFYMVKPISLDDVKHIWQCAISPKNVISNQTTTIIRRQLSIDKSSSSSTPCSEKEIIKSKSTSSKLKNKKEKQNSIAIRKPKVIWTNSLHNRFLQAIRLIGLHKAVPKKILEFMNVPGLTRENVASHLQKYRIFLKRVAEKGAPSTNIYSNYTLLRSSFANSSHFQFQSSLNTSKFQSQHSYFLQNKQLIPPLNYQCPILGANNNNLSHLTSLPNPNLEGLPMEIFLPHIGNQNYSSLLTLNEPNFPCNGFISSSTQDNQNFVLMENANPKYSSNGVGRKTTGEDQIICLGQNGVCNNIVQAPHDLNNGGLSLDNNEDIGEQENCFDVLSEIFIGHNHNQTSLRKEEMDASDIWNGVEMDASIKQDDQPSTLSSQAWDDGILEMLFGDGSSSS